MDMSQHHTESMAMPMVFHTAMSTSLFTEAWTPRTPGQYAGTCLTLICLTILLRALIAFKPRLESTTWGDGEDIAEKLMVGVDDEAGNEGLGVQEPSPRHRHRTSLMREGRVRVGRALYEVVIALLGYLLMLTVMSMNVGYFLSILLGVFLGTLGLGGIARDTTFDHCS
ncbi:copper transporter [Colletotrichum karsti]|uniref:Copper transport protein n=1 Tax=Colletotrichum karsti TaxID=1095194 RepID=A0A9P6I1Y0_9PEZI|nr:copper transporter [Colletotrichum karsti]KAF9874282.1 copper transporter [Colletotrichum karsti]